MLSKMRSLLVLSIFLAAIFAAKVNVEEPPKVCSPASLKNQLQCPSQNDGKKMTRCMIHGDPHVVVAGYRSEAMGVGANWMANFMETSDYRLQVQTFHCRWRDKTTVVCGFAVTLPDGSTFGVFNDGKEKRFSVDCQKKTEAEVAALKGRYVKLQRDRVFLCLGKTTVAALTTPAMKITIWSERCKIANSFGWCSAPFNNKFYTKSADGYTYNPAKVQDDQNLFFCKVHKFQPVLPKSPSRMPPAYNCPASVEKQATKICLLGMHKFNGKKCPYDVYLKSCVTDLCLNFADRRVLLSRSIRDYLDEYLQRGVKCPFAPKEKIEAAKIAEPAAIRTALPTKVYKKCFSDCLQKCTPDVSALNKENQAIAEKMAELRAKSAGCASGKESDPAEYKNSDFLKDKRSQNCYVNCYVKCETDPLQGKPYDSVVHHKIIKYITKVDENGNKKTVVKVENAPAGAAANDPKKLANDQATTANRAARRGRSNANKAGRPDRKAMGKAKRKNSRIPPPPQPAASNKAIAYEEGVDDSDQ